MSRKNVQIILNFNGDGERCIASSLDSKHYFVWQRVYFITGTDEVEKEYYYISKWLQFLLLLSLAIKEKPIFFRFSLSEEGRWMERNFLFSLKPYANSDYL